MRSIILGILCLLAGMGASAAGLNERELARLEELSIIPATKGDQEGKGPALAKRFAAGEAGDLTRGLAEEGIATLAQVVINRAQEGAYGFLNDAAGRGLDSIEALSLPGGAHIRLTRTRGAFQAGGIKTILNNPYPFLNTFLMELPPAFLEAALEGRSGAWRTDLIELLKDSLLPGSQAAKDPAEYARRLEKIVRPALLDLANTEKGGDPGLLAMIRAFLSLSDEQVKSGDVGALNAAFEAGLGKAVLGKERKAQIQELGSDLLKVYNYFWAPGGWTQREFMELALGLSIDLASAKLPTAYAKLLDSIKTATEAVIEGDYDLAAGLVGELPGALKPLLKPAALRGISILATAGQYGLYYAADQEALAEDKDGLRKLRTQILEDFIADNTDRQNRGGTMVVALEGDLAGRLDLGPGFPGDQENPYSLAFGLAGDYYFTDHLGVKLQASILDLGSYVRNDGGNFSIADNLQLGDALLPSLFVAAFYDCGVLLDAGLSFGLQPSTGSGAEASFSLRLGVSVPIFDIN